MGKWVREKGKYKGFKWQIEVANRNKPFVFTIILQNVFKPSKLCIEDIKDKEDKEAYNSAMQRVINNKVKYFVKNLLYNPYYKLDKNHIIDFKAGNFAKTEANSIINFELTVKHIYTEVLLSDFLPYGKELLQHIIDYLIETYQHYDYNIKPT